MTDKQVPQEVIEYERIRDAILALVEGAGDIPTNQWTGIAFLNIGVAYLTTLGWTNEMIETNIKQVLKILAIQFPVKGTA